MRIVATSPVPAVAREAFAGLGEIDLCAASDRRTLERAEVLVVRGERLGRDELGHLPALRAIARTGAGYDNLDVEAATARAIPILYAPGAGTGPVAEGTLALILAAAKRLRELGDVVEGHGWDSRYEVSGLDLEGASLGVIGFGSIGRHVARLCQGLGMRVLAHDPVATIPAIEAEAVPLVQLLRCADVVTFHCALTAATRGLVDRAFVGQLKRGAVLVNAARGPILQSEDVLVEALDSGRLAAVALDVYPTEPPDPSHRLFRDRRVICTPHTVGLTARWNEHVFHALARGLQSLLAGGHPDNLLNPEALAVASARPADG